MNKVIRNISWMCAGLLLTLVGGTPALADDTELLLVDPNNQTPKPNIMLIIDSSGSMGTQETTREPYDYTQTYPGTCDNTMLYWTEVEAVPSCDPSNDQLIAKSVFHCEDSTKQLQGIGIYAGKMAQFRTGTSGFWSFLQGPNKVRWQEIAAGNPTGIVDCKKDSGKHGDGSDPTLVYPQKGGDVAPYTDSKKDEINWRSWPTSQNVTVYDGNYLNYRTNPVFVQQSRIGIVQTTAKVILNSISNVNVGIMRFNSTEGGPVIFPLSDLDTNRQALLDTIDAIPSNGWTPVSETTYESALYWRGMPAYYGELINENPTAPGALASTNPEIYAMPPLDSCAKNYNVVLTDGAPTNDIGTAALAPTLPNFFAATGQTACTGSGDGACLDDIAAYLYNEDINPNNTTFDRVVTHTIGFSINLPILAEAAQRGGGGYFLADDIESLTLALMKIFTEINEESLSFAAPAVAVNTFNRTQNFNDLYLTTFKAAEQTRWPGNLKKYQLQGGVIVDQSLTPAVDPNTGFFHAGAQSFWSANPDGHEVEQGGAASNLPDPATRNVYTDISGNNDLTAGANALDVANVAAFTFNDLGLTGSAGEPTKDDIIEWARGVDVQDVFPNSTVRNQMGDPLHSQPAAVVYGGTAQTPDVVVYTATNEGFVHAVDASTGVELWSFIPREHLPNLSKLFFNPESTYKHYGVDGDIVSVTADRDNDGEIEPADGDFVYIIFGMRRGGKAYYMLDVTDRNQPIIKWRVSEAGFGQSWSRPTVAKVDMVHNGLNADKAVVIIGGGYDTVHDTMSHPTTADVEGAGIYMLDLETGAVLWRAGADLGADLVRPAMTRSIPTQIRAIDLNGDGFANRMYTADMGGQVWRFDIFKNKAPNGVGADALVAGGVVAQLGAEGMGTPSDADTRRFYNSPDVSIFNDNIQNRRYISISIGSGYRAHPLDTTNTDRFYSIRDKNVFNSLTQVEYDAEPIITEADLVEVSGQVNAVIGQSDAGWMFTLPPDQMVLSGSTTFNNEVFFVAFSPDTASATRCSAGRGKNILYRVKVDNADPIADIDNIAPGDEDAARQTVLAQGGIAPSPRFLFPAPDSTSCPSGQNCSPEPVGCIGVECFDPGFANNPVRTLWTQDGIE